MASRIKGISVEIGGDTTKLQTALKGVDGSIRNTQSQLKDVENLLKLDPKNIELLEQKQRLLGTAIEDTRNRLDTLKTASEQAAQTAGNYDDWKAAYDPIKTKIGETSEKLKDLKEQAKNAEQQLSNGEISQEQYDNLQTEIQQTSDKLKDLKENAKQVSDQFGNPISPEQYDALQREIIETQHDLEDLETQANHSADAIQNIADKGEKLKNIGDNVSNVGNKFMPVTGAVAGLATAAVKTTADFDSSMSKVKAVSGATDEEFESLREKAREMGSQTKFSASEAADAMNYMAMAGWKSEDMLTSIDGIMNLAASSGADLATTSDIVTDAMTALGIASNGEYKEGISNASHFADVLAAASSNANTNVEMLGESFQYVAPVAGSMGASAEDLSIALGLMANSGIKGTQAGNALKNALINITKPTKNQMQAMTRLGLATEETITKYDADEIAKKQTIVENKTLALEKAQNNYTEAVNKYGEDSTKAKNALISIETAENNLTLAQNDLTKAQNGTIEKTGDFKSAFVDAQGNMKPLGETMNILRDTMGAVNVDLVDSEGNLKSYDDIIGEVSETADGLTQAEQLKNAAMIFGKENLAGMLSIINATDDDYNKLTNSIYDCDGTAKDMSDTMQDNLAGQLTILKSQLQELAISFGDMLMPIIRKVVGKIQGLVDKLNGMDEGTRAIIISVALFVAAIAPALIVIGKLISAVGTIMTIIPKVKTAITAVKTAMSALNITISLNPIGILIGVLVALVAAFIYLWNNCEDFRQFWIDLWENIKSYATKAREFLSGFFTYFWNKIKETVETVWGGILDFFVTIFTVIGDFFSTTWSGILEFFITIFEGLKNAVTTVWGGILEFFVTIFTAIGDFFSTTWGNILDFFITIFEGLKNTATTVWTTISDFFAMIWDGIKNIFTTVVTAISDFLSTTWENIKTVTNTVFTAISDFFTTIWDSIKTKTTNFMNSLKTFMSYIWTNIKNTVSNLVSGIKDNVLNVFGSMKDGVKEKVSGIFSSIKDTFSDIKNHITGLASDAWNWGADFIDGLVNGIKSGIQNIIDTVSDVAETIKSYLHFSVPDVGPLTDYESWMPDFMKGLAKGIKDSQSLVSKAINGVANDMIISPQIGNISGAGSAIGSAESTTNNLNVTLKIDKFVNSDETDINKLTDTISNKLNAKILRQGAIFK